LVLSTQPLSWRKRQVLEESIYLYRGGKSDIGRHRGEERS